MAVLPVGEGFFTTLEKCGEAFLGEIQSLPHGLDVGASHQAEMAGFDPLDLFAGFRSEDFLAEAAENLNLDVFDESGGLVFGGGKVDVERGGVSLGLHGLFFKCARMAWSSLPVLSVCMEIRMRFTRLPWRAILT